MAGLQHKLWAKLRTGRKPPSFWQRLASNGLSLAWGWSQALISGSPLAQSVAKTPSLLPDGSSPLVWQERHHGRISYWNSAIHQSSRCPGFCTGPLPVCEVDSDEKVGIVRSRCSAADGDQLSQIRRCLHFLHVFLTLSWFCKHYRWHVLRV